MRVLLSIHDVMPSTMDKVAKIIDLIAPENHHRVMLLVVPGLDWQPEQIAQLHQWAEQGFQLVGHGWKHHTEQIDSWFHKLHALFISRNVAEHLSISSDAELALMQQNRQWFTDQSLPVSDWYVPPAWAFGKLEAKRRARSGYRFFESTFFVYDGRSQQYKWLPMMGYEADTWLRQVSVKLWNAMNRMMAGRRPIRMAIHPGDLDLLLSDTVRRDLAAIQDYVCWRQAL